MLSSRLAHTRAVRYRAIVTTAAKDSAGNRLDQNPDAPGNQPKAWILTLRK